MKHARQTNPLQPFSLGNHNVVPGKRDDGRIVLAVWLKSELADEFPATRSA
jgi:hypothetical protein